MLGIGTLCGALPLGKLFAARVFTTRNHENRRQKVAKTDLHLPAVIEAADPRAQHKFVEFFIPQTPFSSGHGPQARAS